MMCQAKIILVLLCSLILFHNGYTENYPKKIVFATIMREKPEGQFAIAIYDEIGKRMGVTFEFVDYPIKRASETANSGKADGEPGRMPGYNKTFTNLIMVNEPILKLEFTAYTLDKTLHVSSPQDLKKKPYKIDYLAGIQAVKILVIPVVGETNFSTVNSIESGLYKLMNGRSDLFINISVATNTALQMDKFKDKGIRNAGVLFILPVHTFLHKKHKNFAPALSNMIKELYGDGTADALKKRIYDPFVSKKE